MEVASRNDKGQAHRDLCLGRSQAGEADFRSYPAKTRDQQYMGSSFRNNGQALAHMPLQKANRREINSVYAVNNKCNRN